MTTQAKNQATKLVALASIAAVLHSVKYVAWGVSLAAKNAKVISAQAGDKGRGFQPITNFIDEIAQLAMNGVSEISDTALQLSKISVEEQRSLDAFRRFAKVKENNKDAKHIKSLDAAMKRAESALFAKVTEYKTNMKKLNILMETMDENMLSARAIASVSRIVTSNAQEYRANLEVVANNLDEASNYIKEKVSTCYKYLNDINTLRRDFPKDS